MLHLPSKLPYPISFCNTKNTNVDFVIRNHILELVLLTPPVLPSANSRQRILTASVCNLYPQIFTAWTYPKPAGAAWNRLEPSWAIWNKQGSSGAAWNHQKPPGNCHELHGTSWNRLSGTATNYLENLEPSGAIKDHQEPPGITVLQ